ncbi:MAG TPA: DUF5996 family protein [Anaerolineae bacterium]
MSQSTFPSLPLSSWQSTRDTIAGYAQVVGKVRRALTPPQKHWWHISLRLAAPGLTTTPIPAGDRTFEMLLDFKWHELLIITSQGERHSIPLQGQSLAAFCTETLDALAELGIKPEIDLTLFADDTPGTYDEAAVARFWQALSQIDVVFKAFKATFRGESSPVQLWPHHFDLALLWFSGRLVPGQGPNDPEYADEQMNFGFSTGDAGIPNPYFYATAYPQPEGLTEQSLPSGAYWHTEGFTGAVMMYEALTTVANPKEKVLDFLHAAHHAGSSLMQ